MRYVMVLCSIMLLSCSSAFPVQPKHQLGIFKDKKLIEDYLNRFYPMKKTIKETLQQRIKRMQEFFHLTVTGTMDSETVEVMEQPRCGVPDVLEYSTFPGRPRWSKTSLTYRVKNHAWNMRKDTVDAIIAKAFKVWSDVTPLRFTKTTRAADIEIFFARLGHGDPFPFDGRGRALAHAFAPGPDIGGDAHFDDDEIWSETGGEKVTNLFLVAAHEIGHSLGLAHSNVFGALMYPTYSYTNTDNYQLPADDVRGIQSLYGGPERREDAFSKLKNFFYWWSPQRTTKT